MVSSSPWSTKINVDIIYQRRESYMMHLLGKEGAPFLKDIQMAYTSGEKTLTFSGGIGGHLQL